MRFVIINNKLELFYNNIFPDVDLYKNIKNKNILIILLFRLKKFKLNKIIF
jgi:hypothetical protein